MRAFTAFFKKECLDLLRTGKLYILGIIFCLFGIMNPAIAKLTPLLLELLSDSLSENGMTVTAVSVDAITSWTQFFKNIPMALIAFVCMFGNAFTKEYESGTLLLVLTKGIPRYKVYISKVTVQMLFWTIGYWLCFGITYGYNAFYWDNSVTVGLWPAVIGYWSFGIWVISLLSLLSVLSSSYIGVLLGTGAIVFLCYLLSAIPTIQPYLPTAMTDATQLMKPFEASAYFKPFIATASTGIGALLLSVPLFNHKQL